MDMERELRAHRPFAIFQAKAESVADARFIVPSKDNPRIGTERVEERVMWRVQKIWVGPYSVGARVETNTNVACCICGLSIKKGDIYIIHLPLAAPTDLSNCSYSKPLGEASADLKILDKVFLSAQP